MQKYSQIVLRVGLGLVFFWFATQQLQDPTLWTGVLPDFTKNLPLSQITFIYLNGIFEIIFGILLILGFQTRIVTLILALHMFGIVFSVGYNATGVRDFGLAFALVSIFLNGESAYSLDEWIRRKKSIPLSQ